MTGPSVVHLSFVCRSGRAILMVIFCEFQRFCCSASPRGLTCDRPICRSSVVCRAISMVIVSEFQRFRFSASPRGLACDRPICHSSVVCLSFGSGDVDGNHLRISTVLLFCLSSRPHMWQAHPSFICRLSVVWVGRF